MQRVIGFLWSPEGEKPRHLTSAADLSANPQRFEKLHQVSPVQAERLGRCGAIAGGVVERLQNGFAAIAIDRVMVEE